MAAVFHGSGGGITKAKAAGAAGRAGISSDVGDRTLQPGDIIVMFIAVSAGDTTLPVMKDGTTSVNNAIEVGSVSSGTMSARMYWYKYAQVTTGGTYDFQNTATATVGDVYRLIRGGNILSLVNDGVTNHGPFNPAGTTTALIPGGSFTRLPAGSACGHGNFMVGVQTTAVTKDGQAAETSFPAPQQAHTTGGGASSNNGILMSARIKTLPVETSQQPYIETAATSSLRVGIAWAVTPLGDPRPLAGSPVGLGAVSGNLVKSAGRLMAGTPAGSATVTIAPILITPAKGDDVLTTAVLGVATVTGSMKSLNADGLTGLAGAPRGEATLRLGRTGEKFQQELRPIGDYFHEFSANGEYPNGVQKVVVFSDYTSRGQVFDQSPDPVYDQDTEMWRALDDDPLFRDSARCDIFLDNFVTFTYVMQLAAPPNIPLNMNGMRVDYHLTIDSSFTNGYRYEVSCRIFEFGEDFNSGQQFGNQVPASNMTGGTPVILSTYIAPGSRIKNWANLRAEFKINCTVGNTGLNERVVLNAVRMYVSLGNSEQIAGRGTPVGVASVSGQMLATTNSRQLAAQPVGVGTVTATRQIMSFRPRALPVGTTTTVGSLAVARPIGTAPVLAGVIAGTSSARERILFKPMASSGLGTVTARLREIVLRMRATPMGEATLEARLSMGIQKMLGTSASTTSVLGALSSGKPKPLVAGPLMGFSTINGRLSVTAGFLVRQSSEFAPRQDPPRSSRTPILGS